MLSLLLGIALAKAPGWVRAEPFTVPGKVLQKQASKVELDEDVVILLEEKVHRVEPDGTVTTESRLIWQLRGASARDGWSSTSASWAPWRAERPTIEARVIQPSGEELRIDPEQMEEGAARGPGNRVLSDRRTLSAELPPLQVGAVVEERIRWSDSRPYLGGGTFHQLPLESGYRGTQHLVHRLEVAEGRPLTWSTVGPAIEVDDRVKKGVRTVGVHIEQPVLAERVPGVPEDVWPSPVLLASSVQDWATIGASYAETLEGVQESAGLEAWIAELKALPEDERVDAAYRMAQGIRYTSIAFGENAIKPVSPIEVLERGFADCKDKANLLITLLDEVGVEGRIALVRSGFDRDVDPAYPGSNMFNHAIVYLPGSDRWLDPTSEVTPADEVPLEVQGRHALVIDGAASQLRRVPDASSDTSIFEHTRTYDFTQAPVLVTEELSGRGGWVEFERRSDYENLVGDEGVEPITGWLEENIGTDYVSHVVEGADDRSADIELTMKSTFDGSVAEAYLFGGEVLAGNGDAWRDGLDVALGHIGDVDLLADRTAPFSMAPHEGVSTFRTVMREGFVPLELPETFDIRVGPLSFERRVSVDGQVVEVRDHFVGRGSRVEVEDAKRFRQQFQAVPMEPTVHFVHRAVKLFAEGDIEGAFDAARADRSLTGYFAEVSLLGEVGLNEQAVSVLQEAAQRFPDEAAVHAMLGTTLLQNGVGEIFGSPLRLGEAKPHLERAIELGAHDSLAYRNLSVILQMEGVTGTPSSFERALALRKEAIEREETGDSTIAPLLLIAGLCDEAEALEGPMEPNDELAVRACGGDYEGAADWLAAQPLEPLAKKATAEAVYNVLRISDPPAAIRFARAVGERLELLAWWTKLSTPPEDTLELEVARTLLQLTVDVLETPDSDFLHPSIREREADLLSFRRGAKEARYADGEAAVAIGSRAFDVKLEGSEERGWRATIAMPDRTVRLFLVRGKKNLLIRAMGADPRDLALHARELASRKDLEGAGTWLNWAMEELGSVGVRPEIVPLVEQAFRPPRSLEEVEEMATLLEGIHLQAREGALEGIAHLARATEDEERRTLLWQIFRDTNIHIDRRIDPELVEEGLAGAPPLDPQLQVLHRAHSYVQQRRVDEIWERFGEETKNPALRRILFAMTGQVDAFLSEAPQVPVPPAVWNAVVWDLAVAGRVEEAHQVGVEHLEQGGPDELHTLAVVSALAGDYARALDLRQRLAGFHGGTDWMPKHWALVEGLLLHRYGYEREAGAFFAQVENRPDALRPVRGLIPEDVR